MNIHDILDYLKAEISKLDAAINALEGSPRRGRPPKSSQLATGKRTMSADARRRIGLAMKLAWAKRKRASAPKKAAAKKAPARKPMSPAMKKKLSAMMKARWAAKKKAAGKE